MLPDVTSKHVGTATELTCLVPLKSGFLPTLDTRTYATRLRAVFRALQALRAASREVRTLRPVVDIVEAARTVHAFSWSIVAERQLLLNVAFDRPWEPYIRVIWKDLGRLLDLFLCNCEGFVPSTGPFDKYADFVHRHQVDTSFFYPSSSLSVDDQRYLVRLEKTLRDHPAAFAEAATALVVPGAEETAAHERQQDEGEARVQWQIALELMFGLRGFFPPVRTGTHAATDDDILRRAAHALLDSSRPPDMPRTLASDWFDRPESGQPKHHMPREKARDADLQGGVVSPYKRVSHGCLLLARVERPAAAREFIGRLAAEVTTEADAAEPREICRNVAFTFNGLKQVGVADSLLARLPKEFREGMEARAGLLGDVRHNHPEHWKLPEWNVEFTAAGGVTFVADLAAVTGPLPEAPRAPVRMATVDLVILLHARRARDRDHDWDERHPLYPEVVRLAEDAYANGIRVMSVQPLRRISRPAIGNKELSTDHFKFAEGISQPNPNAPLGDRDRVKAGDLIVGFANDRKDDDFLRPDADPTTLRGTPLDLSSFLVVRKLRQHVDVFEDVIERAVRDTGLDREAILGKMMGRWRDGTPLIDNPKPEAPNDFDFGGDASGEKCPFHSHIRRGNPRLPNGAGSPLVVPRIARRGLAYGPPVGEAPDTADRGIMFMAYNASIAEQFEIIQRWMAGGNTPSPSNGATVYGPQPDPILGLPDVDGKRTYRFMDDGRQVRHIDLGPDPLVTLQWGLYLMTPSVPALRMIAESPAHDEAAAAALVAEGERIVARLKSSDDWAAALEDVSFQVSGRTGAVFAYIRAAGGAIRTDYGVIVASHGLGMHVLANDRVFSVSEYQRRFGQTVGEGYLGMDFGPEYVAASTGPNAVLANYISQDGACALAYEVTKRALDAATTKALTEAQRIRGPFEVDPKIPAQHSVPLPLEPIVSAVLGTLARQWFDIPDGVPGVTPPTQRAIFIDDPATREAPSTLSCPFSFLAPSRYVFSSPQPRPTLERLATERGSALLDVVRQFVVANRAKAATLPGTVTPALFAAIDDDDRLARVLLGLVFGFVPTVHGSILQVLAQWLGDETLWRVQQVAAAAPGTTAPLRSVVLTEHIERAMQLRPVPPLLHRTATTATTLGPVSVKPGDRVVVAIASMTQETLAGGRSDVMTIFGGNRAEPGHPTHACPGAHIALGVIHGVLLAILDRGPLTPTGALFTVRVPIAAAIAGAAAAAP